MESVSFITNQFPGLTATFMYREVLGLRKKGIKIRTFSIRKPNINTLSKECHDLLKSTTYLLPIDIYKFIVAHCYFLIRSPLKYFQILVFLMTRRFENKIKDRLRTFVHFCEGVHFAKLIKDDGTIKHIHAHFASHSTTLTMVASILTKIPFSFTAHAYDIWTDKLFLKEKVNAAKFVITCSKYGKNAILENDNIENPEKISTIYHGIDIKRFKPQKSISMHSKLTILNVGRVDEGKAQKNLIMACKILRDEGYVFECQVIGDGPLFNYLQELVKENQLQEVVTLVGMVFQENIKQYYHNADIFVFTSIKENLPNVLLESLAMGVPVVTSNIAGIPELIKDGETGILIRPNDIQEIADAIKLLITDRHLARRLADNGRTLVCEQFDEENSVDQIIALYRSNDIF